MSPQCRLRILRMKGFHWSIVSCLLLLFLTLLYALSWSRSSNISNQAIRCALKCNALVLIFADCSNRLLLSPLLFLSPSSYPIIASKMLYQHVLYLAILQSVSAKLLSSWMGNVPDSTQLTQLSIPYVIHLID